MICGEAAINLRSREREREIEKGISSGFEAASPNPCLINHHMFKIKNTDVLMIMIFIVMATVILTKGQICAW